MQPKIKIANSDLTFTRIGFGCEQMGFHNWGDIDANEISKAVQGAIEKGVNFFDTADVYGLGKSEQNLGKLLGKKRKSVHIISKFGVRFNNSNRFFDNSPEWISNALHSSLKRLNTDYIDLYQLHYWDEKTPFDSIYDSLNKFKKEGKIRAYGFSNVHKRNISLQSIFFRESSLFSYESSLVERQNDELIKELNKKMPFIAYGILGQGILTGKYNKNSIFPQNDRRGTVKYGNFHGKKLINNLHIVDELNQLSKKYNFSPSNLAIRYILDYFQNSCTIIGFKNQNQLEDSLNSFNLQFDQNDFNKLTKLRYEFNDITK